MTKDEFKNLEVGEKFVYDNKKLQVKEAKTYWDCTGCYFNERNCITVTLPHCYRGIRKDKKSVVFVEVEDERNS